MTDILGRLGGGAKTVRGVWQEDRKIGNFKRGYLRPRWSIYQFRGWMVNPSVRIRCWGDSGEGGGARATVQVSCIPNMVMTQWLRYNHSMSFLYTHAKLSLTCTPSDNGDMGTFMWFLFRLHPCPFLLILPSPFLLSIISSHLSFQQAWLVWKIKVSLVS